MKSIWILILVSIVANAIGAMNKANQKKKPEPSAAKKPKRQDYDNRYQKAAPQIKLDNDSAADAAHRGMNYDLNAGFSYKTEESAPMQNDLMQESEEALDAGLTELQQAIVMAEVLGKPLALRKS